MSAFEDRDVEIVLTLVYLESHEHTLFIHLPRNGRVHVHT